MDQLQQSILILSLGILVILAVLLKSRLKAIGLPSSVGFIAVGFLLNYINTRFGFITPAVRSVFEVLMKLGVIALLFEIGLESDLGGLVSQLRKASLISIVNLLVCGFAGFAAVYWVCGMGFIPSLFAGTALTATSVGISLSVWKESGSLKSPNGELLLDIAELDDIMGIVLMALVVGIAPVLRDSGSGSLAVDTLKTFGIEIGKFLGFTVLCVLFSRYVEKPFSGFFRRMTHGPDPMIVMAASSFIIAAVAGFLGFSVAIGGFFAGLIYSRDPKAVRMEASFDTLYDFFVPFFFIGIGLSMEITALTTGLLLGGILLIAAVGGKLLSIGGAALTVAGKRAALLLGTSMVPRAEITVIVMEQGRALGNWAVPESLFNGIVIVSLVTSVVVPIVLRRLLKLWPQKATEEETES